MTIITLKNVIITVKNVIITLKNIIWRVLKYYVLVFP